MKLNQNASYYVVNILSFSKLIDKSRDRRIYILLFFRYGRKISFLSSSVVYIISAPLAAAARGYVVFLLLRLLIGAAGSGVYHTAYTLCRSS